MFSSAHQIFKKKINNLKQLPLPDINPISCRCQATPPANKQTFGWYFPRQQVVFQSCSWISWPLQVWGSGEATLSCSCCHVKYCKYKEDVHIQLFIRRKQRKYCSWWKENRMEGWMWINKDEFYKALSGWCVHFQRCLYLCRVMFALRSRIRH